jgi:hypothetical protein
LRYFGCSAGTRADASGGFSELARLQLVFGYKSSGAAARCQAFPRPLQCRRRTGGYSLSGCYDFLTVQASVRVATACAFDVVGFAAVLQFLMYRSENLSPVSRRSARLYYYIANLLLLLLFSASRLLVQLTNADLEMLSTWLCFLTMLQSIVGISSFCQAAFRKGLLIDVQCCTGNMWPSEGIESP